MYVDGASVAVRWNSIPTDRWASVIMELPARMQLLAVSMFRKVYGVTAGRKLLTTVIGVREEGICPQWGPIA
eukprot:5666551-Pyramimonas_sp.AAC.1